MTDNAPKNNGRQRPDKSDPLALQEEIERTRIEVGDTVESLMARTDVRGQARGKAAEVAGRTRDRLGGRSEALRHKGEEWRDRLAERGGPQGERIREALPDQAQDAVRQAAGTARQNPKQVAGVLAALLATRWVVRRRHRRRRERAQPN